MGYIEDLKKMYEEMYNSRYSGLDTERKNNLQSAINQENQTNNYYADLVSKYNQSKLDTTNKYKNMYTGLDNEQANAKQKYYNDRNSVAVENTNAKAQTRDWLASNNLLASGESVDAMLRANTDYSNAMGNVYSSEQATNKQIADTRSQYQGEETSAITGLDNDILASEREKSQKLAEILAYKQSVESDFGTKVNSLKSELEASKIKDINEYNERLRQEAVQKQREEEQRKWEAEQRRIASSYSSSGSGSSGGYSRDDMTNAISNAFNQAYMSGDMANAQQVLADAQEAVNQGYMTASNYKKLSNQYDIMYQMDESYKNMNATQRSGYSQTVKAKPKTYGYRNGKAGYY